MVPTRPRGSDKAVGGIAPPGLRKEDAVALPTQQRSRRSESAAIILWRTSAVSAGRLVDSARPRTVGF